MGRAGSRGIVGPARASGAPTTDPAYSPGPGAEDFLAPGLGGLGGFPNGIPRAGPLAGAAGSSSGQNSPGPGPSRRSIAPPGASRPVPFAMFTPVDLRRSAPGADSNSPGPGPPPLRTAASNTPPGASFPDAFPMFTADRAGFVRSSWYSPGPGASSGQTAAPPGASCPVTGIFTPGAADFPPPRPRPAVPSSGQCSPGPGTCSTASPAMPSLTSFLTLG